MNSPPSAKLCHRASKDLITGTEALVKDILSDSGISYSYSDTLDELINVLGDRSADVPQNTARDAKARVIMLEERVPISVTARPLPFRRAEEVIMRL